MRRQMAKRILIGVMILLFIGVPVDAHAQAYTTKQQVFQVIKENLLARKPEFTIKMNRKTMNAIGTNTELLNAVTALDDKSTSEDADYLKQAVNKWSECWKSNSLSSTVTLTFQVEYATTRKQEQKLSARIDSVLKSLKLTGKSDYEKVKAIHNYIINRVSYDQTLQKHTAYNALINKSAVCEGYSAAAYRMFTEAGIDCRIITGWADAGAHSWNIVKVDGKWYNIDLTWDDPITSTGEQVLTYNYFLKNTNAFSDHIRESQYGTSAFLKQYPIAKDSYAEES